MTSLAVQLRLQNAIYAVIYGDSVRHAAKREDIDKMAIHHHLEDIPTRDVYNESRQLLSQTQESWLANWVITRGKLKHPPPLSHFRHYAQRLLYNNGVIHILGKNWYTKYLT
jgi:hypothetical protein